MPTFNEIQQEITGMLSIPDEEFTPEQRLTMSAYMDELAKIEADKVDGFGQFLHWPTPARKKQNDSPPRQKRQNHVLHG